MSGETQRQDDASEGDGRAWTPPPPHETPETLGDRYSSNLSQRPTPLAALDDLDAEDRAGFEELAERLKVARRDPKNVFHTTELESALDEMDALRRRAPPRPAVDRRSVSAPVEAVASLEADLDALRRDVASLRPRQQVSRPTWLIFAAAAVALTAWILMPPEDPFAAALTS
jgi:hypothetical protein